MTDIQRGGYVYNEVRKHRLSSSAAGVSGVRKSRRDRSVRRGRSTKTHKNNGKGNGKGNGNGKCNGKTRRKTAKHGRKRGTHKRH